MKRTKMQKGITLIALIITIIILLILAVVIIGSIKNSNIITYAQNASTDYEKAKNDEDGILAGYESTIKENFPGGEKVTYTDENVPIPAGFYYVTGKKDTGLVISDNKSDEGNDDVKAGNQFVWVPVPDIDKFAKLQSGSDVNYEGKLYDFTATTTTEMKVGDYGIGTLKYREPDVLTKLYNPKTGELEDVSTLDIYTIYLEKAGMPDGSTSDDFKIQLQKEFNEMVASVEKYKGFYVGRYETSLDGTKPQSKASTNSEQPIKTVTALDSSNTWYGLYALNKKYTTISVKSSMIWGSQYDAMMVWMEKNGANVKATGDGKNNTERTCGTKIEDKINNIYDLYGNSYECTLEADNNEYQVYRSRFLRQ